MGCSFSLCNCELLIGSFQKLREEQLREKEQQEKLLQLQNGQVSLSPEDEQEPAERVMGLDLSTSYEQRERNLQTHKDTDKEEQENAGSIESSSKAQSEALISVPTSTVVVRERARTIDEPSQKTTRAKRESRRMRELEQAKFSLELLKVRANSGGASSPSEERRWSVELVPPASPPLRSPQGTPDSQSSKGSFELLIMDEDPPKATEEVLDSDDPCSPLPPDNPVSELNEEVISTSPKPVEPLKSAVSDDVAPQVRQGPAKMDLAVPSAPIYPPKIENYLPTFYIPASEGSAVMPHQPAEEPQQNKEASISTTTTTVTRPHKERRESTRRPVVVVISMQKETPLSEELSGILLPPVEVRDSAAQTGESTTLLKQTDPSLVPQGPVPTSTSVRKADQAIIEKLVRLNEEKEERQRYQQQQNEKEMMEQIRQQKEELERQRLFFAQYERDMFEKQREEALHRIQQIRQGGQDPVGTATSGKPLRPSSLLLERIAATVPHARTQSDSTAPSMESPTAVEDHRGAPQPQLPPPPTSAPREKRKESRPAAEGWAPKLTLESRDGGGGRVRTAVKKPGSNQGTAVSMTDKSGNIFFSPKDKVTFAK